MRRFSAGWLLLALLGAAVLLFVLAERREERGYDRQPGGVGELAPGSLRPGSPAPMFHVRTLAGRDLRFPADFRGRLVLLDFWATWCPPCRAEIPRLVRVHERFGPAGFAVVGVTLDGARGVGPEAVRRFADKHGLTWPQVYDQAERLAASYRVTGIPSAFLVDGTTGRILAVGESLRGARLEETVSRHLQDHRP